MKLDSMISNLSALAGMGRYFVAVIGGYALDFLVYAILVNSGLSVYLASVIAFCTGMLVNVLLIRRFVFPQSRFGLTTDALLSFIFSGLVQCLGLAALWLFTDAMGANPYAAKLLANGVTFVITYAGRTRFFTAR